jgi:hypothetical protein
MWLSWDKLNRLLVDNDVIFFGAGEWAEKTLRKIKKKPLFIIDNSKIMQNTKLGDVEIVSPDYIKTLNKNSIILITTGSFETVVSQLTQMGYTKTVDFFCSPVLFNQKLLVDIKENNQTLIFTNSDIPEPKKNFSGGGLYSFNTGTSELVKHVNGKFHEIIKIGDKYFVADEYEGVKVFDLKFEHLHTYKCLPGSIMHGLSYDEQTKLLFASNTGRDSISVIELAGGKYLDEIFISKSTIKGETDRHHINDICFYKGYLYISMFSFSGLWHEGCYDGGVAKLDLENKRIIAYPIQNLWMPHSINFINGEIVIADSMNGDVYKTNNNILVNFPGFIRGITYDGKYYYIAQSEHRYFDRLKGINKNIAINCGIHVYDDINKASRFHSFFEMSNIHTVIIEDEV